ncbi:hypothetical protein DUHN55_14560 [Helicobacter pylori]
MGHGYQGQVDGRWTSGEGRNVRDCFSVAMEQRRAYWDDTHLYDVDGSTLPDGEEAKAALVETVLDRAREHVAAALPFGAEVDAEGVRRVTIEGLQTDPCGGTHVRTTADLTGIQITRVRTKKGQLKLSYTAQHA